MVELDDFADQLYEPETRVEEQDLRLLKAIVTDDSAARQLNSFYSSDLFVGDAKPFADAALAYFKSYNTLPTRRVIQDFAPEAVSTEKFTHIWDELDRLEYNKSEFSYDLDKIKDRYSQQEVYRLKSRLEDVSFDTDQVGDILQDVRSRLDRTEKIRRGKELPYTQKTMKEYLPDFRQEFVLKSKNPDLGKGVLTGYSYLDYITNGLQPSDMVIVGASTGGGKSMMLSNMAIQMWKQDNSVDMDPSEYKKGHNVLYFSLEMPYDQCFRRAMSRLSDISGYALRDAQILPAEAKRLAKAAKFIDKYESEFSIVDMPRGLNVDQVEERFLEECAKGNRPEVVVVDYIGLMEDPKSEGEDWLRLGLIAGRLHEFARAHNVIVLTAVQLNRPKGKDPSDIIGLHRIGRSSHIMHHATIGIQIETRPDEETYSDMPYHIIKNRNGEQGSHLLQKKFSTATLVDQTPYKPMRSGNDSVGSFTAANIMEDLSEKLKEFGWDG